MKYTLEIEIPDENIDKEVPDTFFKMFSALETFMRERHMEKGSIREALNGVAGIAEREVGAKIKVRAGEKNNDNK
ncbi:hypothetical protein M3Y14_34660 (plasmid) [Bacillus thuringiensis]|uniref:hypothetical protein n=1 Tax=Bacillus thuringiensis TaxID=1428 RepID=UPI00222522F8|nr:hypothetical protein [Bacillus thuringiensis]UYX56125.1 hypothetical protein M3Y14_34660 [Bacillus thuringiensis]